MRPMPAHDESFVEKLSRQGEEALGKIAEELIANPVVNGAIARAFDAREKAVQAQEAAMGALNLPSAADIERGTARRASRGGSWRHHVKVSRIAARSSLAPDRRYNDYGMRVYAAGSPAPSRLQRSRARCARRSGKPHSKAAFAPSP